MFVGLGLLISRLNLEFVKIVFYGLRHALSHKIDTVVFDEELAESKRPEKTAQVKQKDAKARLQSNLRRPMLITVNSIIAIISKMI